MGTVWCQYQLGDTVRLGGAQGIIVEGAAAADGEVVFSTPEGDVAATVLKAAGPGVVLPEVQVWLVRRSGEGPGHYALMVDDAYWGVRVQPAEFSEPGISRSFVDAPSATTRWS